MIGCIEGGCIEQKKDQVNENVNIAIPCSCLRLDLFYRSYPGAGSCEKSPARGNTQNASGFKLLHYYVGEPSARCGAEA